eukprot:PITA_02566
MSRPPERYSASLYYVLLTDSGKPECYEEEVQVETRKRWEQAMKEEIESLAHNQTWDIARLPAGKTTLQNKWVYKLKEEDGGRKRCMNNPGKEHWMAVKWIFRYLRGTTNQALCFGGSKVALQGYVDADMAEASKEMIWLQRFLDELGKKQKLGRLYSDSQSAIHLAKNSAFHFKTKHIKLKYHFIWSALEDGQLKLEKIHTSQNPTDMLKKVVTREKLRICSVLIGLQV